MLYLLDASVLIDASNTYYEMQRVPQYWDWLLKCAQDDLVKIPYEIFLEVKAGPKEDDLLTWVTQNKSTLILNEEVHVPTLQKIQEEGYADDLTESEVKKIGNDPFLIAYAFMFRSRRAVVTAEVSKPSKKRANRRIPDVCNEFKVHCINPFQLNDKLDFRTL